MAGYIRPLPLLNPSTLQIISHYSEIPLIQFLSYFNKMSAVREVTTFHIPQGLSAIGQANRDKHLEAMHILLDQPGSHICLWGIAAEQPNICVWIVGMAKSIFSIYERINSNFTVPRMGQAGLSPELH